LSINEICEMDMNITYATIVTYVQRILLSVLYIVWGIFLIKEKRDMKTIGILGGIFALMLVYIGMEVIPYVGNYRLFPSGEILLFIMYGVYGQSLKLVLLFILAFLINRKDKSKTFSKYTCWIIVVLCIIIEAIIVYTNCISMMFWATYAMNIKGLDIILNLIKGLTYLIGMLSVSLWEAVRCTVSDGNDFLDFNKRVVTRWCAPMFCGSCKNSIKEGDRFCNFCGKPIQYVPVREQKTVITENNVKVGIAVAILAISIIAFIAIDVKIYEGIGYLWTMRDF